MAKKKKTKITKKQENRSRKMVRRRLKPDELLTEKAKEEFFEAYVDARLTLTPKEQTWLFAFCTVANFNKVKAAQIAEYANPAVRATQFGCSKKVRDILLRIVDCVIDPMEIKLKLMSVLNYDPRPIHDFVTPDLNTPSGFKCEMSDVIDSGFDITLIEGIDEKIVGGVRRREVTMMSRTIALSTLTKMLCSPDNVTNVLAADGGNITIVTNCPGYNERPLLNRSSDVDIIDVESIPVQTNEKLLGIDDWEVAEDDDI